MFRRTRIISIMLATITMAIKLIIYDVAITHYELCVTTSVKDIHKSDIHEGVSIVIILTFATTHLPHMALHITTTFCFGSSFMTYSLEDAGFHRYSIPFARCYLC